MNYILLVGVGIFLYFDQYIEKRRKYILAACIAASIILNIKADVTKLLDLPEYRYMVFPRRLNSFVGYTLRPALLWGFWEQLQGEKPKVIRRIMQILVVGNFLIFTTCFYSDLSFGFEEGTNHFLRGPLGWTAHIVMAIMMILFIPTLTQLYRNGKKRDFIFNIVSLMLILGAVCIDTIEPVYCLHYVITLEGLFYLAFSHLELEKEHTKALIEAQKADMMLMQIKPHFINNTLGTIQALCSVDPPLAEKTIGQFARYLRTNLTVMDKQSAVSITEEIEHTKIYLEIEKVRFPWIEAEYDIQDTDFCIPALTIQPLAENAVQHGLRKQKQGKIKISTERIETGHMIKIFDNGVGFDEDNLVTKTDHGIGLKNVRYRIEKVSHGTMQIVSDIDKGTTITIIIP